MQIRGHSTAHQQNSILQGCTPQKSPLCCARGPSVINWPSSHLLPCSFSLDKGASAAGKVSHRLRCCHVCVLCALLFVSVISCNVLAVKMASLCVSCTTPLLFVSSLTLIFSGFCGTSVKFCLSLLTFIDGAKSEIQLVRLASVLRWLFNQPHTFQQVPPKKERLRKKHKRRGTKTNCCFCCLTI